MYIVKLYDNMFCGFHGIVDYYLDECSKSAETAREFGIEECYNLIDSYPQIYDALEADATNDEGIFDELLFDELMVEDIVVELYTINDTNISIDEIRKKLEEDPEEFIDNYCSICDE